MTDKGQRKKEKKRRMERKEWKEEIAIGKFLQKDFLLTKFQQK